jgi:organic hydroperoxide reductase OsmC/OhrA
MTTHTYASTVAWAGSTASGYRAYSRAHTVTAAAATLMLSADAAFHGDAALPNPEQLLVAAVSSCQLLSFLGLAARHHLDVLGYEDRAEGFMDDAALPARISRVVLRPVITVAPGTERDQVTMLARQAHEGCFIAHTVTSDIELDVSVVGA